MSETWRVSVLENTRYRAQFFGVTPDKLETIVLFAAKLAVDPLGPVTITIEREWKSPP